MTLKGEALKPNFSELQKIEADYDPEKDYDSPRLCQVLGSCSAIVSLSSVGTCYASGSTYSGSLRGRNECSAYWCRPAAKGAPITPANTIRQGKSPMSPVGRVVSPKARYANTETTTNPAIVAIAGMNVHRFMHWWARLYYLDFTKRLCIRIRGAS